MSEKSIEQICRDFLEEAIGEGLVVFASENFGDDISGHTKHVQELTSGDLAGLANWLAKELKVRDERLSNKG